ncbi:hypothetical protein RJ640_008876 [Escallonia rubra]|uniref:Auxin-responsive protein SAUR32 n=1 Tax=Escallonia rubra TaxID=112253 RepID=A0AA88QIT9_9ASTE|nr:hypothetical protein RJ640_008876 [Escallonia rubra]
MGINGEKSLLNRHIHLPNLHLHLHLLHHHHHHHHGKKQQARDVPKGCLAIKVGVQDEEQQRFVVPVMYFNHPLFMQLLKEAEEEYGFDQKGAITLPCHVEEFRYVQSLIDREQHHHHHHHHHVGGISDDDNDEEVAGCNLVLLVENFENLKVAIFSLSQLMILFLFIYSSSLNVEFNGNGILRHNCPADRMSLSSVIVTHSHREEEESISRHKVTEVVCLCFSLASGDMKRVMRGVPKGCLGIRVGVEGEEQQRFVVPVTYVNHPLFMHLLKEADDEYGFHQEGAITLPCHIEEFWHVWSMIDQEEHHHHYHRRHHQDGIGCFGCTR